MKLTILSDECIPNCPHGSKCGRCKEVFGQDKGKGADVSVVTKTLDERGEPYLIRDGRENNGSSRHRVLQVLVAREFALQFFEYPDEIGRRRRKRY